MRPVVADTGVLVAAAAVGDRDHARSVEAIDRYRSAGVVVPATVAVEVDYLLRSRVGTLAARAFLADLLTGRYIWEPVGVSTLARAIELDRRHADLDLGLVDVTVVAVAESLNAAAILTLDVAHFSVCAPHVPLEP
ncbi:MAG: type II toxin-antitoxin system VapC family toxin [Acidimicrobiia bacterium]